MTPLETAAHVVQLALAPVFLLSGIGTLLGVFATRLGRVADQVDALASDLDRDRGDEAQDEVRRRTLNFLRLRSIALDWAVVAAALAGALTCGAVLTLFLGAVAGRSAASLLYLLFGGGIVLTLVALSAFVVEMLLATSSVRLRVETTAAAVRGRRPVGLLASNLAGNLGGLAAVLRRKPR